MAAGKRAESQPGMPFFNNSLHHGGCQAQDGPQKPNTSDTALRSSHYGGGLWADPRALKKAGF